MISSQTTIDDETKEELEKAATELRELAEEFGLRPNDVNYWIVDHDEIIELAAYGGFQRRYPHWRWGMKYDEQKKKDTYAGGKIFELVNHDVPSNAFLQKSNSMQEQKSVIAHVEAHADFFANNSFFSDDPDAAAMLERHANTIESYYDDTSIDYEAVEEWIDSILCVENNIDQLGSAEMIEDTDVDTDEPTKEEKIESLDVSDDVRRHVFGISDDEEDDESEYQVSDVLAFLLMNGKQYDEETERAEEYEDWQRTIMEIIRREAYYFAPQKMTKIMNEGWAAMWESRMMMEEQYADVSEVIDYADKQSQVLNSPGLNPYKIGKEIWTYIENKTNRKEVVEKILRTEGISWRNFHSQVDFSEVADILETNADQSVPCERHYSLTKPQNRGFVKQISKSELQKISRYMFDSERYETIEEALNDVRYESGWERIREVRETHNDITFIDEFLTNEFVDNQQYFAYEFNPETERYQVSGTDLDSVKKKLLLQITNGGKPTIVAADKNYNNAGELLLNHKYNGIPLDIDQSKDVLKKVFRLWGRPVNLKTIDKDAEGNEQGYIIRYDGVFGESTKTDDIDDIRADQIDYDTKPDSWT